MECLAPFSSFDIIEKNSHNATNSTPCLVREVFPQMTHSEKEAKTKYCDVQFPCKGCEMDFVNSLCPLDWTYIAGICYPNKNTSPFCTTPMDFRYMTPEMRRHWTNIVCGNSIRWPCIDETLTVWSYNSANEPVMCRIDTESVPCPNNYTFVKQLELTYLCVNNNNDENDTLEIPINLDEKLNFIRMNRTLYSWSCISIRYKI